MMFLVLTAASSLFIHTMAFAEPTEDNKPTPESIRKTMTTLSGEISDIVKAGNCASDQDCKSIGMGANPCGGALSFLIYSSAATDEKALQEKVDLYNSLARKLNKATRSFGICSIKTAPSVACFQNICSAPTVTLEPRTMDPETENLTDALLHVNKEFQEFTSQVDRISRVRTETLDDSETRYILYGQKRVKTDGYTFHRPGSLLVIAKKKISAADGTSEYLFEAKIFPAEDQF